MSVNILDEKLVVLDAVASTKDDALRLIAKFAFDAGRVSDEQLFYESVKAREDLTSTGFTDGIAIPHGKSSTVIDPSVLFVRFKDGIDWDSMDGKPTNIAIALAIPDNGANLHLKILSSIARKLMDDEFKKALVNATTATEVVAVLENAIK